MAAVAVTVVHPLYSLPDSLRACLEPVVAARRKVDPVFDHSTPFSLTAEPIHNASFRVALPPSALFTGMHLLLGHIALYLEQQLNHPPRNDGFRHIARVKLTDLHTRDTELVLAFDVALQLTPGTRTPRVRFVS